MLCKEGKIDLRLSKVKCNLLLFFILTIPNVNAQIYINGFCQVNKYPSIPGYQKIYQTDFNLSKTPDILFYTSNKNNVVLHPSTNFLQFEEPIDKFFYFPISDIKQLSVSSSDEIFHVFVSSSERLAGLVSITKYGTLQLLNMIKFDSFPSEIILTDLDKDFEDEAIVFGSAFEGLLVLKKNRFSLAETKFVTDRSFSEVVEADLDFDGYPDLIAKDVLNNSLSFFYNNQIGGFDENRTLPFDSSFSNLKFFDYNNDGFSDLFYSTENGINIVYGDSVYSFADKDFIKTPDIPDDFLIKDLNLDGISELVYLNKVNGKIYYSYIDKVSGGMNWVNVIQDTSITDIQILDNSENAIISLSSSGYFYIFSRLNELGENNKINYSINPTLLELFENNKNKLPSLAVIDEQDHLLKILHSGETTFNNINSYPVADLFENIIIANKSKHAKLFYLYTDSSKVIQLIKTNLIDNHFSDEKLYSPYPIIDLAVSDDSSEVNQTIYTLVKQDSVLGISEFRYRDFHYVKTQFVEIAKNFLDAKLEFDSTIIIQYVKEENDSLLFNKIMMDENKFSSVAELKINVDSLLDVKIYSDFYFVNDREKQFIIDLHNLDSSRIEIILDKSTQIVDLKKSIVNDIPIWFAKDNLGHLYKIFEDGKVEYLSLSNCIESEAVSNYFCTQINDKMYLVYLNKNQPYINFLELK